MRIAHTALLLAAAATALLPPIRRVASRQTRHVSLRAAPGATSETDALQVDDALKVDDSALGVNATIQERLDLFRRLAVPYFQQAEGAKLQFGLLLVLVLCQSGVSVIFSFVGRDFYSALSAKDLAVFQEKTANYAVGLAVATPLTVLYKFQRQRLALSWRQWMTGELAKQYYQDRAYYRVELDRDIDNPDQRLTEDVAAFTKVSLDFFITVLTAVIDLASFSGILYSIYPNLFYAIFAYATFGSLTTVALGKTRPAPASFFPSLLARANRGAAPAQSSARTRSSCSRRRTCATASCACARTRSRSPSTAARPARPRRSARASTAPWRTSARSWARSGTSSSSRRRTRTSCRSCPCSSSRRSTSRARSSSAS